MSSALDRAPPDGSPLGAYRARLAEAAIKPDAAQAAAIERLQLLWGALKDYRPAPGPAGGWRARLGFGRAVAEPPPRGVYLHGGVGRGKSMVMDLFFAAAPTPLKRRVHFHAFMLEIHERLHRRRQVRTAEQDPIAPVAREIASEAWLLCFDEFQVTNIADAMILGRLLAGLLDAGVVIVATSNSAPDVLYAGGLQRDRFLPAIALIKDRLDVVELDGRTDFRRNRIRGMTVFHMPLGLRARAALDRAFADLTDSAPPEAAEISVQGRVLTLARTARGVARASFAELCARPLGPADFLALASRFHTLILDDVPALGADNRNEARRFITLIDALYEHRAKLVCSAAAGPDSLLVAGDHAAEFRRAASRLHEMQSAEYLEAPHQP
jgi:cell division protein ZapE